MLSWKTDWSPSDIYPRNGSDDLDRLQSNYEVLAAEYVDVFAINVGLQLLVTDGYKTLPFSDFLGVIESNLRKLYAMPISGWIDKDITWLPASSGPDYTDINRWEHNGQLVETMITNTRNWMLVCGVPSAGQPRFWQQRFRRR